MEDGEDIARTWEQLLIRMAQEADPGAQWAHFSAFVQRWYGGRIPNSGEEADSVPALVPKLWMSLAVSQLGRYQDWAPGLRSEREAMIRSLDDIFVHVKKYHPQEHSNLPPISNIQTLTSVAFRAPDKLSMQLGIHTLFSNIKSILAGIRSEEHDPAQWQVLVGELREASRRLNEAAGETIIDLSSLPSAT